jgi:hypothetical protein
MHKDHDIKLSQTSYVRCIRIDATSDRLVVLFIYV